MEKIRDAIYAVREERMREGISTVRSFPINWQIRCNLWLDDLSHKAKMMEDIFADIDEQKIAIQNIPWEIIRILLEGWRVTVPMIDA
jgi:hypothetical protein